MCNKFKKIDIKNPTCYFLDDIDIKILVPSKFKIDKKSKIYIYIPIHSIGFVTVKDLTYAKINSVNT